MGDPIVAYSRKCEAVEGVFLRVHSEIHKVERACDHRRAVARIGAEHHPLFGTQGPLGIVDVHGAAVAPVKVQLVARRKL